MCWFYTAPFIYREPLFIYSENLHYRLSDKIRQKERFKTQWRRVQRSRGVWEIERRGGREGEIDWGEMEPDREEKVRRGRGMRGSSRSIILRRCFLRKDGTFFSFFPPPVSLLCLTSSASLLLIRKHVNCQLQLHRLPSTFQCNTFPGLFMYV